LVEGKGTSINEQYLEIILVIQYAGNLEEIIGVFDE